MKGWEKKGKQIEEGDIIRQIGRKLDENQRRKNRENHTGE